MEKPVFQSIELPATVNINANFTITVTVTDSELLAVFYSGELYANENGG